MSHTGISLALRQRLLAERILMVVLPSHCTGVLQVCDTHLFDIVKIHFRKEANRGCKIDRASWIPTFFMVRARGLSGSPRHSTRSLTALLAWILGATRCGKQESWTVLVAHALNVALWRTATRSIRLSSQFAIWQRSSSVSRYAVPPCASSASSAAVFTVLRRATGL